jgi:hypothetical protein
MIRVFDAGSSSGLYRLPRGHQHHASEEPSALTGHRWQAVVRGLGALDVKHPLPVAS